VKVTFSLRKRSEPAPAEALLYFSENLARLLALCTQAGTDPLPAMHRLAGGFLLVLHSATFNLFPGIIRLRRLAGNLFLPADADLVPPLLADEAEGLTRECGLVFLPGGSILGFASGKPLSPSALLRADNVQRPEWQPFPVPRAWPKRIEAIVLDQPQDAPENLLEAGGEGIGEEEPRPEGSSLPARAVGQIKLGLGRRLMRLGQALGLKGLARWGARLVAAALEQVPRLTESLLGKQEAALRALLREFRKGNQEKALRRALPLRDDRPRGPLVSGGSRLPFNELLYSLADLLKGDPNHGPFGAWQAPADVFKELKAEYRRAAAKAAQRGDYRRAAYILGKLLFDFRAAADALFQAGLYRDAAILYERKAGDHLAAARAYERGGAFDEALRIYARRREHWAAADLLLRLGDMEAAEVEYRLAADHVAATLGELKAGEMLLDKAKRPDLARAYFLRGWQRGSAGGSVGCALHLARLYSEADERLLLQILLSEAEKFFAPAGNDIAAGQFFNLVAGLADRPNLASVRDDLRDRALLALAGKLRQRARVEERPGDVVAQLLGSSPAWLPAQVTDGQFAFRAAVRQLPPAQRRAATLQAGEGTVTAAAFAAGTGDVLVGFAGGEVACLHPATGSFGSLPPDRLPVLSLASDHNGQVVVVLRREDPDRVEVSGYRKQGEVYVELHRRPLQLREDSWLTPQVICHGNNFYVGLGNGTMLDLLWGPLLLPDHTLQESSPLAMAFLLSPQRIGSPPASLLLQQGTAIFRPEERGRFKARLGWTPQVPKGSTLSVPPLAGFLRLINELELAGLSEEGITSWSLLAIQKGEMRLVSEISSREGGNQAVAIVRPGYLAAAGPAHVDWLRVEGRHFRASRMILDMPPPVACFPSQPTGELIIVCNNGGIVRVTVPT
jgi:hypothetical protein